MAANSVDMQTNNKRNNFHMSFRLPLKQAQIKNRWITVALVAVYAFIAIFIVLNK